MKTTEHIAFRDTFNKAFCQNIIHDIADTMRTTGVVLIPPYKEEDGDEILIHTCVDLDNDNKVIPCQDAPGCGMEDSLRPRIVIGEPVVLMAVSCTEKGQVIAHIKYLEDKKEAQWEAKILDADQLIIIHHQVNRALGFDWNI